MTVTPLLHRKDAATDMGADPRRQALAKAI